MRPSAQSKINNLKSKIRVVPDVKPGITRREGSSPRRAGGGDVWDFEL